MPEHDFILKDITLKPREIGSINLIGLKTLVRKEVGRFLNVYSQTIIAPLVTTILYYAVFALAFGGEERQVGGMPYMVFLAPGLIMMTMVQNAFANTSSSLIIAKIQGNIVDILMPPISPSEFFIGYLVGGVLRGLVVGIVCALAVWVCVGLNVYSFVAVVFYGVMGTSLLSILGMVGGIWSEKFDHIAAVTNFIVTPMTFLSGTFYSTEQLSGIWHELAHYNPFFYMIDGFRYGFTGHADGNIMAGAVVLIVLNACLGVLAWQMIRSGYKIKS